MQVEHRYVARQERQAAKAAAEAAASVNVPDLCVRMEIAGELRKKRHGGDVIKRGKSGQTLAEIYTWRLKEGGRVACAGVARNYDCHDLGVHGSPHC